MTKLTDKIDQLRADGLPTHRACERAYQELTLEIAERQAAALERLATNVAKIAMRLERAEKRR